MISSNSIKHSTRIEKLISCLNADNEELTKFVEDAQKITLRFFEKKRTLFNPVYVSDICLADCPYCGFRISNKTKARKTLKPSEAVNEVNFLLDRGVDNVLLLAGDYKHSKYVEMLMSNIKAIKHQNNVNWLGIEIATLETEEYALLRSAGADSVTVFQETYNRNRYITLHNNSEFKGDFDFRYNAQQRAIQAGFKEVGLGVLYGIGFWKEDTIGMAEHAMEIQEKYPGIGLRFSFPRLQLSETQDENCRTEDVSEHELLRAIVGIRLMFPQASLVLTGRESVDFLTTNAAFVNILGYNGSTAVGGYTTAINKLNQFELQSDMAFQDYLNLLTNAGYSF